MNIVYSFRTRGVGAESVHISGISRAFEKLGNKVHFASPCGIDPGSDPYRRESGRALFWKILAERLPRLFFEITELTYNVFAWFRVTRRLRSAQFGLIYERHAFFLFATGFAASKFGIPLVVEVNELVGDERVRRQPVLASLAAWCDKRLFDRASLIVVVSPYLKRQLIKRHDIPEEKIQIHCNAVDDEMMENRPDADRFIREFKLNGKFNLGFVGWFVEWHHLDVLIEVFARLCNECPEINANLLLVGNGPLHEKLIRKSEDLGMAEKVTFTGVVEHGRVPEALQAMDIAIIPHSNEYRSPIKLFEYMAQGCAVVAPQTEPISMVIDNGENGLLFTPLDKDQIFHSLARLATDADLRLRMGNRARQHILNRHTWRHNAQRIIDKFQKINS